MRNLFIETLTELAQEDERIVLLTGDLGFTVLEPFAERFPDRFYNAGVAEQNMVGMATGLAEAGFIPFAYSIATFASMRPYEFIRNGPVLHRLPVRIVGIGGGFDYGHNGATHYALEDVGVLRTQPSLGIVVPADDNHARSALIETYALPQPFYYRISKTNASVPGLERGFELGRLAVLREGTDVALIAMGPIVGEALAAATSLERDGVSAAVALVPSFNPTPENDLVELISGVDSVLTVESHYRTGALGSAVAEVIADHGLGVRLRRCGIADIPRGQTGTQGFLEAEHGISAAGLTEVAQSLVGSAR
jgi:transketolase